MQTAAMRRIDPDGAVGSRGKPRIGCAFGSVPVDHVGGDGSNVPRYLAYGRNVAETQMAGHGNTCNAECQRSGEFRQDVFGLAAAGGAVCNQSELVAASALTAHQI